ncbi:MAG: hypothetical protein ACFE95_18820 [Candidatus Hodarchaeota archaeon]
MKTQVKRLNDDCLQLIKTSESVGYCRFYRKVISYCPEDCPGTNPFFARNPEEIGGNEPIKKIHY